MIMNEYKAYCDECATFQPLVARLLTEARTELMNLGWTSDKVETGAQHWYCPTCSVRRVDQQVNGSVEVEPRPLTITE